MQTGEKSVNTLARSGEGGRCPAALVTTPSIGRGFRLEVNAAMRRLFANGAIELVV
jgi:hypothetical protein